MMEISDARELRLTLLSTSHRGTWTWWAPGDATRYRVVYVNPAAHDTADVPFQRLLVVAVGRDTLAIPQLHGLSWTSETFLATFGEKYAGWWAGVRPILAVFGWTTTRPTDLTYSAADAVEIGKLLSEAA